MYNKTTNKNISEYKTIHDIKKKSSRTADEILFLELETYIEVAYECYLKYIKDENNFSIYSSDNNEYEKTEEANKKTIKAFIDKCLKVTEAFEKEYQEKIKSNKEIEDFKVMFISDFYVLECNSHISNVKEDIFKNDFLKEYETKMKTYIKDFKLENLGIRRG